MAEIVRLEANLWAGSTLIFLQVDTQKEACAISKPFQQLHQQQFRPLWVNPILYLDSYFNSWGSLRMQLHRAECTTRREFC